MRRIRRLYDLWSWLPAFRVVAETEHLPTASEHLGVSPQALSRAVKLLEQQIDRPLFRRVGRRVELNDAGAALLTHVRNAMRGLDEGLGSVLGDSVSGEVRVGVDDDGWVLVGTAVRALQASHPEIVPLVHRATGDRASSGLRRGAFDVVVVGSPQPEPALVIERVATLSFGVYAGRDHPLSGRRKLTTDQVQGVPFAVSLEGGDGWPPDVPRRVAARVSSFDLVVELCRGGSHLAVLPDAVVATAGGAGLRRLPLELVTARPLFLCHRAPVSSHPMTEALVTALHLSARELTAGTSGRRRRLPRAEPEPRG